jgi:hypothetical protein
LGEFAVVRYLARRTELAAKISSAELDPARRPSFRKGMGERKRWVPQAASVAWGVGGRAGCRDRGGQYARGGLGRAGRFRRKFVGRFVVVAEFVATVGLDVIGFDGNELIDVNRSRSSSVSAECVRPGGGEQFRRRADIVASRVCADRRRAFGDADQAGASGRAC